MCILVWTSTESRVSDPPELELQTVVSDPMRMLGSKPRSSTRTVSTLNHWVIFFINGCFLLPFVMVLETEPRASEHSTIASHDRMPGPFFSLLEPKSH